MNSFRRCTVAVAILAGSSILSSAGASPPKEWKAAQAQAQLACVKASELRDAKPIGDSAVFDDSAPLTAMVIGGTYPQAHMKGQKGTVLCLYDRKSQRARTVEWAPLNTEK